MSANPVPEGTGRCWRGRGAVSRGTVPSPVPRVARAVKPHPLVRAACEQLAERGRYALVLGPVGCLLRPDDVCQRGDPYRHPIQLGCLRVPVADPRTLPCHKPSEVGPVGLRGDICVLSREGRAEVDTRPGMCQALRATGPGRVPSQLRRAALRSVAALAACAGHTFLAGKVGQPRRRGEVACRRGHHVAKVGSAQVRVEYQRSAGASGWAASTCCGAKLSGCVAVGERLLTSRSDAPAVSPDANPVDEQVRRIRSRSGIASP